MSTEIQFALAGAIITYIIIVCACLWQNRNLLRHADKRLDKANEMVLTLAHSADKLSDSISVLKDMMTSMSENHDVTTKALTKNRDEYRDAYLKLLTKYEQQEDYIRNIEKDLRGKYDDFSREIFNTIKEMARKPTITNNPTIAKEQ